MLDNGSVVTWGGGLAERETYRLLVKTKLNEGKVEIIYSNHYAFVAKLNNGKFVAWGIPEYGGKIPEHVQRELDKGSVKKIYATATAFAALKTDGSVLTWGDAKCGGHIPDDVQKELKGASGAKEIYTNRQTMAAISNNGSVLFWGEGAEKFKSEIQKIRDKQTKSATL